MNKNRIPVVLLIISLVGNGALIWLTRSYIFSPEARQAADLVYFHQEKKGREFKPLLIKVAKVKQMPVVRKKTVPGTIKAITVPVVSDVQGRVKQINFTQGSKVKKGEILVQLDDAQAKAQMEGAKAQVKVTSANYQRQKLLSQTKYGLKPALDKAEADFAVAMADLGKAEVQLNATYIKAPFDGRIGLISISVGSLVDARQEITRLVKSNPINVDFQVPEIDAKYLHLQQEVDVLADAYTILPIVGVISAISPYSNPISHTIDIKALIDNDQEKLRDGGFARVTIPLSHSKEALVVPKEAIVQEGDEYFVFLVKDNRAHKQNVIVGITEGNYTEITDGIKLHDVVATDPVDMLSDGIPIKIDTTDDAEEEKSSSEESSLSFRQLVHHLKPRSNLLHYFVKS